MPPPRSATAEHALELFAPAGTPRARRMFGGWGLYVDDLFVALVADERLYLKADDETRPRFEGTAGCERFVFVDGAGREAAMGYWSPPADALDSPDAMAPWLRLALGAALRARAARRPAKPPRAAAAATPPPGGSRGSGGARRRPR